MDRQEIERISKALGDETRLMFYEAIRSGERVCCGELVSMRGVTPATVSHHLKILSEAGLIECRREGQFVYSEANPNKLEEYARSLSALGRKAKRKTGK